MSDHMESRARENRIANRLARFTVRDGFVLDTVDPGDRTFRGDATDAADSRKAASGERLASLQERLYASRRVKVLVVLQGMDTSGKDGTVKCLMRALDPLGVRPVPFKAPNAEEQARDFLWRVHREVPKAGEVAIFNRSHYEDVLVPWVHRRIDDGERERRFAHIRDFERMLVETGTVIVKCMLLISRDEQRKRLQARIDDPDKRWKIDPADLEERRSWDRYMEAYQRLLVQTSTEFAPWVVVPADSKSNRDAMVLEVLRTRLEALGLTYPPGPESLADTPIV